MEIRLGNLMETADLIEEACMLKEASDYADALKEYFINKAEHIAKALAEYPGEKDYCLRTYDTVIPCALDILEALGSLKTVLGYISLREIRYETAVEDEIKKPTRPQTDEEEDSAEHIAALLDALFERHSGRLHVNDILRLREKTPGLDDNEFTELFELYGTPLRERE